MKFSDLFRDFVAWIVSLPAVILSVLKEDGPDSPFSARRVSLMFDILAGWYSLENGFQFAFAAAAAGADWKYCAVFLSPFVLCVAAGWAIITNLTATDIKQIVSAAKE